MNYLRPKSHRAIYDIDDSRAHYNLYQLCQYYVLLDQDRYKYLTLCDMLDELSNEYTQRSHEASPSTNTLIVIFCSSIQRAQDLYHRLLITQQDALRANPTQSHGYWDHSIATYCDPNTQSLTELIDTTHPGIIITIDGLSSEGISWRDCTQSAYFFHYDMPDHHEDYLLRIGRTERFRSRLTFFSIAFILTDEDPIDNVLHRGPSIDCRVLSKIEEMYMDDVAIEELPVHFASAFVDRVIGVARFT